MDSISPTMTIKKSATPYGITNERKLLMKILVCGARDYGDVELIHEILNRYRIDNPDSLSIIEGGASGADLIASVWANRYHVLTWYWRSPPVRRAVRTTRSTVPPMPIS